MAEAPNTGQIAYWNEVVGATWAQAQDPLDRQLGPLGAAAMAALRPAAGERILDVGCGAGATSLALAQAVGPQGSVTGIDISAPLLAQARRRAEGVANLSFIEADAQTHPFEAGTFDAVFSRFGVMFFADPPAAFANIRRALKPGGRLAFVCWRKPDDNPIMTLPLQAALPLLPEPPAPPTPGAPGPFAFADPERVRQVLSDGGFREVAVTAHDANVGGGDLETVTALAFKIGPLAAVVRETPALRPRAEAAVRAAFAAYDTPDGVKLGAGVWIVTAKA